MIGFCLVCDKPLRGRQKYYCCEAHRKRYERLSVQYPFLSEKRPLSAAFVRDTSGFVRVPSAITTILVVKYRTNDIGEGMESGMNRFAIKSVFRPELAKSAVNLLEGIFQGWDFEVHSVDTHTTGGE